MARMPGCQLTNSKGPVPSGVFAKSVFPFGTIQTAFSASSPRKSPIGRLSTNLISVAESFFDVRRSIGSRRVSDSALFFGFAT